MTFNGNGGRETKSPLGQANTAFYNKKSVKKIKTHLRILACYIVPIVMNGCESWTKYKVRKKKMEATEM